MDIKYYLQVTPAQIVGMEVQFLSMKNWLSKKNIQNFNSTEGKKVGVIGSDE
jgi:hypothetical protein